MKLHNTEVHEPAETSTSISIATANSTQRVRVHLPQLYQGFCIIRCFGPVLTKLELAFNIMAAAIFFMQSVALNSSGWSHKHVYYCKIKK